MISIFASRTRISHSIISNLLSHRRPIPYRCCATVSSDCSRHWIPPEEGSLVVNCAATRTGNGIAGISAIARDCNGDVVAATIERKRCESKLHAQILSIIAACNLIKKLTEEQNFKSITIRTHHKRAVQLINSRGEAYVDEEEEEEEDDDDDDTCDNDDFDGDDLYSITLMGEDEFAERAPQYFKDLIEQDKVLAGLPVAKKAAKSTAEAKKAAKTSSSKEANNVNESAASEATGNALTVEGSNSTVWKDDQGSSG